MGQINVLLALNDIGEGDGPPVLIPGSHKCTEIHPRLHVDGQGLVYDGVSGKPAGTAVAVKEMYLKAGDVLFFTDAITHGSAEPYQSRLSSDSCLPLLPKICARAIQLSDFRSAATTPDPRKTHHLLNPCHRAARQPYSGAVQWQRPNR